MPFRSKAQARWGNSPAGRKALGGAKNVAEWNHATNFKSLPDKRRARVVAASKKKGGK